jgi:hypothetical protein
MKTLRFTDAPPGVFDPRAPKFGGQPEWLSKPRWPLSRSTGRPMRFVCQVPIPPGLAGDQQVAYVFYGSGDADEYVDWGWTSGSGENAVILQPTSFRAAVLTTSIDTGPVLQRAVERDGRRVLEDVELAAEVVDVDVPPDRPTTQYLGEPVWVQNDETPTRGQWRFLMQIDSHTDRFCLNWGDAGVGYVFVAEDGTAARFLWQCY